MGRALKPEVVPKFIPLEYAAVDSPYGPIVKVEDYEDGRFLTTYLNGEPEIIREDRLFEIA